MSAAQVQIFRIPIVGLPELRCVVPVDADGNAVDQDGEPLDMTLRPDRCGADGNWMFNDLALCDKHFRETCAISGIDYEDVVAEMRSLL